MYASRFGSQEDLIDPDIRVPKLRDTGLGSSKHLDYSHKLNTDYSRAIVVIQCVRRRSEPDLVSTTTNSSASPPLSSKLLRDCEISMSIRCDLLQLTAAQRVKSITAYISRI
jgi:hypothetical protein